MTFIFYDTETTGLESAFDQILQFAAIVTDDNFNVLEELNLRCRLQPHILPSPGAMIITGVGPSAIQVAPLSCYQMIREVRAFIERWSPAVLTGFNSISYDEKMLRQAFYQHLHPVYLTNTRGNTRMDILVLAHAVAAWRPEVLKIGLNDKGKPSFKLVHLMAANGLRMGNAHDAHADTRATLDLARFLKEGAPDIWNDMFTNRSKALVCERLDSEELVCFTDRMFKKATIAAGLICTATDNPAAHAMFDLEYDPAPFLDITLEGAKRLLKSSPRPVRILRANNFPVVRSWQPDADLGVDRDTAMARLAQIRRHPNFAAVIGEALAGQYDDMEPSDHIEEQIFGGFPGKRDAALMEKFHKTPWQDRHEICQAFEEPKYRQFGERLIFAEYPAGLPAETRTTLERWCQERHFTNDECKWMTRAKAVEELLELEQEATPEHQALLFEIRAFLGA
jgi:exodeoxyribonuclease-1